MHVSIWPQNIGKCKWITSSSYYNLRTSVRLSRLNSVTVTHFVLISYYNICTMPGQVLGRLLLWKYCPIPYCAPFSPLSCSFPNPYKPLQRKTNTVNNASLCAELARNNASLCAELARRSLSHCGHITYPNHYAILIMILLHHYVIPNVIGEGYRQGVGIWFIITSSRMWSGRDIAGWDMVNHYVIPNLIASSLLL